MSYNHLKTLRLIICLSITGMLQLDALILYTGDNSANQTAPASGAPYYAVARVCDSTGGSTSGSAVYIRGKYLLTANHVSNRSHVTFDGTTFWERDTLFTPVQISGADMKLIKLVEDPGLPQVELFTADTGDTFVNGTMVGWGRGRNPSVADTGTGETNTWAWGNNTTLAKRWGTNDIEYQFTGNITGYTYNALVTSLESFNGNNEAGLALFDSGSGIFVNDGGTWKLTGIASAVSAISGANTSTFGFWDRDQNYFVRIGTYDLDIEAAVPNIKTYNGWKTDLGLYNENALDTADNDGDGVELILEFALNGDPASNNSNILPVSQIVEDSGERYLEISYTRPEYSNGLNYTVQTTTDLLNWPSDSTGIDTTPAIVDNGDGTKTWTWRRTQAIDDNEKAFMRVEISESAP